MLEKTISEVEHEISLIDRVFETYGDLLAKARDDELDVVEMTALASVLHSFYNGVENIMKRIVRLDSELPSGERWHRELLNIMMEQSARRKAVLSTDLSQKLQKYLAFRHFYRHSYAIFLAWEELEKLVLPFEEIWSQTKREIRLLVESLE